VKREGGRTPTSGCIQKAQRKGSSSGAGKNQGFPKVWSEKNLNVELRKKRAWPIPWRKERKEPHGGQKIRETLQEELTAQRGAWQGRGTGRTVTLAFWGEKGVHDLQ